MKDWKKSCWNLFHQRVKTKCTRFCKSLAHYIFGPLLDRIGWYVSVINSVLLWNIFSKFKGFNQNNILTRTWYGSNKLLFKWDFILCIQLLTFSKFASKSPQNSSLLISPLFSTLNHIFQFIENASLVEINISFLFSFQQNNSF